MTLMVAGKALAGRGGLSGLAAAALACVDGGLEWVDWAAGAMTRYAFADESALAAAVQEGLHASPYALMPGLGLMVSPVKLMTLGPDDLATLRQADAAAPAPGSGSGPALGPASPLAAQAQAVLSRHRLLTATALAGAAALPAQLGVGGNALFTALDMGDLMALYAVLEVPGAATPGPTTRAAAGFAVEQARTPREFCDYYVAYLGYVARMELQDMPPAQQAQTVTAALQTLLPLLFPTLDCPRVDGLAPPAEVVAAMLAWQRQGRAVGFARLSEAVSSLMLYSSYTGGGVEQARQTVADYMASWQSFLVANPPDGGIMLQDGATCLFPIAAKGLQGEVRLGADGTITTRYFRRAPPPPSPVPPSPAPLAAVPPGQGAPDATPTTIPTTTGA